jgi:hypothetical protein
MDFSKQLNQYTMENLENTDPIDDQITNQDDAVTNKDGDNNLEQGEQSQEANVQDSPDSERVTTVTPNNDNEDPTQAGDVDEDSSNKDGGPAEENL